VLASTPRSGFGRGGFISLLSSRQPSLVCRFCSLDLDESARIRRPRRLWFWDLAPHASNPFAFHRERSGLFIPGISGDRDSNGRKILARRVSAVALGSAMVFTSIVAIRRDVNHRTYDREIARIFKKALEGFTPQQVVFVSPEYPSFEFYTFHSGQYWHTYLFHQDFATFERRLSSRQVVFYVADPTGTVYGGVPSPYEWQALQSQAVDVTSEIERSIGHKISLRVFVPPKTLIGRAK
jgi:hypothetical protein